MSRRFKLHRAWSAAHPKDPAVTQRELDYRLERGGRLYQVRMTLAPNVPRQTIADVRGLRAHLQALANDHPDPDDPQRWGWEVGVFRRYLREAIDSMRGVPRLEWAFLVDGVEYTYMWSKAPVYAWMDRVGRRPYELWREATLAHIAKTDRIGRFLIYLTALKAFPELPSEADLAAALADHEVGTDAKGRLLIAEMLRKYGHRDLDRYLTEFGRIHARRLEIEWTTPWRA